MTPEQAAKIIRHFAARDGVDRVVISSSAWPGTISRICPEGSRLARRMECLRPDLIAGVYDHSVTAEDIAEDLGAVSGRKGAYDVYPLAPKQARRKRSA